MNSLKVLFVILFITFLSCKNQQEEGLRLWYKQPADAGIPDKPYSWDDDPQWLRALPLGNGSLGVMVYGDVNKERIQLSEESMWSGSPADNDNPHAYAALGKIRQLLFEGKYREATELTNKTQVCRGKGSGHGNGATVPFGCFQTLGDLWLDFDDSGKYTHYYRELDLDEAIARVHYVQDGVRFQREIFTSHPDQVMVARFTADKPGRLSFTCSLDRPERYQTHVEDGQLIMSGTLKDGKGGEGLQYMTRLKALNMGGTISYGDSTLRIENANEVILLLSASTDHRLDYPEYRGRDYKAITRNNIQKASQKSYRDLLNTHIKDYQHFYDRVSFDLANNEEDTLPTDRRIEHFKEYRKDSRLYELIFQFGRYLLISSSRAGTLPANLQGIWANKIQTPWNGDYHTDVNIEMNYWPAEVTNLSELHLPLFDLIVSLTEPGSKTARMHYRADGWVVHPITNVWGYTSPGESASWGMHTGAAAWLSQHIYEHYRFTGDKGFLEKMYPVLKGAVAFYGDWLVEHPETGRLVSGPAVSPENSFRAPDGSRCQISMGPTHDQQVVWQLFDDFIHASEILDRETSFAQRVEKWQEKLAGSKISSDGRLMEWAHEFPELEPGHRHISHLFALHPGAQINLIQTPELAEAAGKSLDHRMAHGGGHTGWSAAWLISQYARLQRAEKARESLDVVLSKSTSPNLFGQHPPFQMDANFGTTAGIAEMLLQSHVQEEDGGYIVHLLPALPESWSQGQVSGLRARGDITVDIKWKNSKLLKARLVSKSGKPFHIRYGDKQVSVDLSKGETLVIEEDLII